MNDEPQGDGIEDPPAATPRRRGPNKAKGKKRGRPSKAKREETPRDAEAFAQVVSSVGAEGDSLARANAEIARLKAELGDEVVKRTAAETAALAVAEAQGGLMQREIQEVPTGKTVRVTRCDGYEVKGFKDNGQEILKPKWKSVMLPTYYYKIDLPPSGGTDLKINGVPLYHGATMEFDVDTLRSVKEIVARGWAHEASITGSNENAYRPHKNPVISARAF